MKVRQAVEGTNSKHNKTTTALVAGDQQEKTSLLHPFAPEGDVMDVKGQEERKKDEGHVDSNGTREVISSEATKFEEEYEVVIFGNCGVQSLQPGDPSRKDPSIRSTAKKEVRGAS